MDTHELGRDCSADDGSPPSCDYTSTFSQRRQAVGRAVSKAHKLDTAKHLLDQLSSSPFQTPAFVERTHHPRIQNKTMRLIAIGSSFAAGPGIPPQVNKDAGRSSNNYANYFARRLKLDACNPSEFLDLSVSAATLLNVISELQTAGKTTFPPQLDSLPPLAPGDDGSDVIITITAGGNDLFYIGSMFAYTLKHTLWGKVVSYFLMRKQEKEVFDHPTIATPQQVSERFTVLLDRIEEKYPKVTVYLVEYFAIMGPDTKPGKDVVWDQEQVQKYMQTAWLLQELYAKAANGRRHVHVVPLAEESKLKHAVGSNDPWVSDGSMFNFFSHAAYHPNQKGMQAAADILFDFHTKLHSTKELS